MGSHNGVWFWGRSKQASIMKFVLMSLVLVHTCLSMDMMLQKIVKQTEKHVLQSTCFGPGNKQKFDLAIGKSIETIPDLPRSGSTGVSVEKQEIHNKKRHRGT